jgi:GNAT superfamily N-acetyltransferase
MEEIVILKPLGIDDAQDAAGLLTFLNPETPAETLAERLTEIFESHPHYHCVGAFSGTTLIGLAGAWIATKIWCGKFLEIDNLVVHPDHRSGKVGTQLIQHLEALARDQGCKFVTLDSYVSNHPSHRLYHRLGFEIWGFHFVKPLE